MPPPPTTAPSRQGHRAGRPVTVATRVEPVRRPVRSLRRYRQRRRPSSSECPGGEEGRGEPEDRQSATQRGDQDVVSSPTIPELLWYLQKNSTKPDWGKVTVTSTVWSAVTSWSMLWSVMEKLCSVPALLSFLSSSF